MTQTDVLIHDLRSALPSIKAALSDGEQAVQRAMSVLATHKKELAQIHSLIKDRRQALRDRRQAAQTSFQAFDQKINQLFNILTAVLKSERDMEMGITRGML